MRAPGRRRETLVSARLKVENQIGSLLIRFGVVDFRPRLKKAIDRLADLRTVDGRPLPPNTMVGGANGRIKKIMAMALARKLLVALWRFVTTGVVPEGVRLAAG